MQSSNEVKWGVLLTTAQYPGLEPRNVMTDVLAYASEAEQLGFDSGWLLEHHFTRFGLCTDPLTMASFLLGRTKRLAVGTAVTVVPLQHPVRLAESVSMIDQLSDGRLLLGIGRGSFQKDFKVFGRDMSQSHRIMHEWVELMQRCWTTGRCSADSDLLRFDEVEVYPEPLTRPHVPVYVACSSPPSVEWAAQHGFPMMLQYLLDDDKKVAQIELYRKAATAAGRNADNVDHLLSCFAGVPENEADWESCRDNLVWYHREFARASQILDPERALPNYRFHLERKDAALTNSRLSADEIVAKMLPTNFFGDPNEMTARLQRTLDRTGIRHVVCCFDILKERGRVLRSMRRFREEVIANIRAAPAG